ncbi:MAG: S41 family peptidase [Phycisphaerales bacterium]
MLLSTLVVALTSFVALGPTPTNPGFEADEVGATPSGWSIPSAYAEHGWEATVVEDEGGGRVCRLAQTGDESVPGALMQTTDAAEIGGKWFELRARVRVEGGEGRGARLWCRINRTSGQPGFFDNMGDRAVTSDTWEEVSILGLADEDATTISLGLIAMPGSVAYMDDVRVIERTGLENANEGPSPLTGRALANVVAAGRLLGVVRWFHPSDGVVSADWDLVETCVLREVEDAPDAAALADELSRLMAWLAPSVQVWVGSPDDAPARLDVDPTGELVGIVNKGVGSDYAGTLTSYAYSTTRVFEQVGAGERRLKDPPFETVLDLGGGVCARTPHVLWAREGRALPEPEVEEPDWLAGRPEGWRPTTLDRASRLASVVRAWNVYQHFYPYWDVVGTRDWAGELPGTLSAAAIAADDDAFHAALAKMLARAQDGHEWLVGGRRPGEALPFRARWIEGNLVVVAADPDAEVQVGDVILGIDGQGIDEVGERVVSQTGASTDAFRRERSVITILTEGKERRSTLVVERDGVRQDVETPKLDMQSWFAMKEKRPAQGEEVAPGIVYVDLTGGVAWETIEPLLDKLVGAKGVIIDLRGYPGSAATTLIQHCIASPAQSAIWQIPVYLAPDQRGVEYVEEGRWDLQPLAPRIEGRLVWLTDERAVSYAESCMAIVEEYKLGEIVGSRTAGTNGNVNRMALEGGWNLTWTGMRVVKHDGRTVHQGVGVEPTIEVTPTVEGIAAGRDEVLERAIEALEDDG